MHTDYDIVIVGGGLVGASLACALAHDSLRIAVVEAFPFTSEQQTSFDARTVALSYGSTQIFSAMGLWDEIATLGAAPIKRIHVSDRGHIGATRLDSSSQGVPALGYVVENRVLGQVLSNAMQRNNNIDYLCPAQLTAIEFKPSQAILTLDNSQSKITARLVVAADGGNSAVRKLSGVKSSVRDYGQTALVANVSMQKQHNNVAYERFTNTGPLALLPMCAFGEHEHRCALVWTVRNTQAEQMMALDENGFKQQLQSRVGERLGRVLKLSQRHAYPICLLRVQEHVRPRLAFIGNAAHTLHPVAGQGFNLGLRDVAALAQVLREALHRAQDPGNIQILNAYATWRRRDHIQATLFTDGLVRLFSTNFLPIVIARNLGLLAMDMTPPLKSLLAKHAMGFVGRLPRLARGLSLEP